MSLGPRELAPRGPVQVGERLEQEAAAVLARVMELVTEGLPGAEHVSVTVPSPQGLVTAGASGPVAWQIDQLQYDAGEGPCITAAVDGEVVVVRDLAAETRWPRFTSAVVGRSPVRSMLSLPMGTDAGPGGSLNTFATTVGAFDGMHRVGWAFAALAGVALRAAIERTRAVNRVVQLESVVALLVHDLRSGMTVAKSAGDYLAASRVLLEPDGQEALGLLDDELARQERLLSDLLELVRAELPSTRATPLLPQVLQAVREHRRAVPVDPGPGAVHVRVWMHPLRLRRILANLLDNADRHGDGATAVRIATTGDSASVAVEDAGPGVPAELRESIFARLLASSSASGPHGSHLGLPLSRLHARLAGGDLQVAPRAGGGSTFVLLLPTADPPGDAGPS